MEPRAPSTCVLRVASEKGGVMVPEATENVQKQSSEAMKLMVLILIATHMAA